MAGVASRSSVLGASGASVGVCQAVGADSVGRWWGDMPARVFIVIFVFLLLRTVMVSTASTSGVKLYLMMLTSWTVGSLGAASTATVAMAMAVTVTVAVTVPSVMPFVVVMMASTVLGGGALVLVVAG